MSNSVKEHGKVGIMFWVGLLLSGVYTYVIVTNKDAYDERYYVSIMLLLTIIEFHILSVGIFHTLEIDEEKVVLTTGLKKVVIPVREILYVRKVNNLVAGMGTSMQRVEIGYGNTVVYAAPANRDRFIKNLTEKNNAIYVIEK